MTLNTKKFLLILFCILMISVVSGLTETGSFTSSSYSQVATVTNLGSANDLTLATCSVTIQNRANLNGLTTILIEFTGWQTNPIDDGTGNGATRFTSDYGDGWIGYNRISPGYGSVFVLFDEPISVIGTTGLTFPLTYDYGELNSLSFHWAGTSASYSPVDGSGIPMASLIGAGTYGKMGKYTSINLYNNINRIFRNDYTATLDENTNIVTGSITKNFDGLSYPSKTYIYDYTNELINVEGSLNSDNYDFVLLTSPIRLSILDAFNNFHNSSLILQPEILYNYTFTPTQTYPNETVEIAWSSNEAGTQLENVKYVAIEIQSDYNAGNKFFAFDENGYWYNYLKNSSGYWGQYQTEGYVFDLGTSFPNHRNITFPASGNWTFFSTIEDLQGNQYYETKFYNVLGNLGAYRLAIYPINGITGDFISGSQVNLLDTQTGVWTNRTVTYNYECAFQVSTGFYKFVVFAPDDTYSDVNQGIVEGIFIVNEDIATTVTLYPLTPEGAIPGDIVNSTVFIGVKEPEELKPVYGATVRVGNQIEKTNSVGIATFQLLNNTAYKAIASASGYAGTTIDFTPNEAVYSFDIALGSSGSVPTGVTPVITTKPVVTVVTPSAWAEGNASVCGAPLKNNASLIEFTKSKLACNGFETAISQSLALAGFIIVILMGIGYAVARKTGAYVGAIVGFVFAWSVALIPFYVFVALIVICVLIFAVIIASKIPG